MIFLLCFFNNGAKAHAIFSRMKEVSELSSHQPRLRSTWPDSHWKYFRSSLKISLPSSI